MKTTRKLLPFYMLLILLTTSVLRSISQIPAPIEVTVSGNTYNCWTDSQSLAIIKTDIELKQATKNSATYKALASSYLIQKRICTAEKDTISFQLVNTRYQLVEKGSQLAYMTDKFTLADKNRKRKNGALIGSNVAWAVLVAVLVPSMYYMLKK